MRGCLRSLRRAAHVREVRCPPLNDAFLQPSCIGTSAFPDFTHPSSIGLTATFLELWHPWQASKALLVRWPNRGS